MKHPITISLFVIAISVAFTACNKKASDKSGVMDEATIIANFKGEVDSAGKWIEEKQKTAVRNPVDGAIAVEEIVTRLQSIKTDGLPADLKMAWTEMGTVLVEMSETLKTIPKPDGVKPADMGRVMQEFMPKMIAIQGKVQPASKKLEAVGSKYGIDMTKVTPDNKHASQRPPQPIATPLKSVSAKPVAPQPRPPQSTPIVPARPSSAQPGARPPQHPVPPPGTMAEKSNTTVPLISPSGTEKPTKSPASDVKPRSEP